MGGYKYCPIKYREISNISRKCSRVVFETKSKIPSFFFTFSRPAAKILTSFLFSHDEERLPAPFIASIVRRIMNDLE